uniref:Uncharacterized protein n=1 Tax=Pristionchus pacificus TaxID=54126 RepID=A0A2A6BNL7_PRIPA|eukprot:PDM67562.1 hypothetical protein PRIPAC_48979 [Pristionchus pacificus]
MTSAASSIPSGSKIKDYKLQTCLVSRAGFEKETTLPWKATTEESSAASRFLANSSCFWYSFMPAN